MKARLIKNSYICKILKVNGITLYPYVFIKEDRASKRLLTHEAIHVDQVRRLGLLRFYAVYLVDYFKLRFRGMGHHEAYLNIGLEKEAYGHEDSWESYCKLYGANRSMAHDPSELFV